ncbi:DUF6883 domain-containing protein [Spirosoma montaniterrae]|uniref:DUF6883 domain-containing protein n=1 Tax=Spirosoma montaniterrae TaxID=1178516 RepID=A0A1P9WRW7_9BACT|nr:DUF6883 domain-containing protein [Spirosoma montaniterrae]AQG78090.1 hypothetical protein AWR27_01220 [Spirosoma montaniterrae]
MLLPFAERAYINDQKLIGYCLSETHISGKHKARVFKASLHLTSDDYLILKDAILTAVLLNDAHAAGQNNQGELYTVDFILKHKNRVAPIRTAWIVRFGESFPRLVSCYVNK